MLSHAGTIIVISLVIGVGISAVILSVTIFRRGKLYHSLRPEARPRRWILIACVALHSPASASPLVPADANAFSISSIHNTSGASFCANPALS